MKWFVLLCCFASLFCSPSDASSLLGGLDFSHKLERRALSDPYGESGSVLDTAEYKDGSDGFSQVNINDDGPSHDIAIKYGDTTDGMGYDNIRDVEMGQLPVTNVVVADESSMSDVTEQLVGDEISNQGVRIDDDGDGAIVVYDESTIYNDDWGSQSTGEIVADGSRSDVIITADSDGYDTIDGDSDGTSNQAATYAVEQMKEGDMEKLLDVPEAKQNFEAVMADAKSKDDVSDQKMILEEEIKKLLKSIS